MSPRRLLAFSGLLLLGGCLYHARENTDLAVADLAAHPFDLGPRLPTEPTKRMPPASDGPVAPAPGKGALVHPPMDVETTALMQAQPTPEEIRKKREERLKIPEGVPGSETPLIRFPDDPKQRLQKIRELYPKLPPLPDEPKPQPGPGGQPYTLADLQQIAAENSPQLRQAASDVEAARGNLIQARAYPNPTFSLNFTPSSDGTTPSFVGVSFDQVIKTGGKLKLASAAAEMDLRNAELALKRARSDLSTAVRNAYYALLVAQETVRVNNALARLTDEAYHIQEERLENSPVAAGYEPAALRAQAYSTRLALKQAIATYVFSWKQLVSTIGLRQLPLTEVAGRIDRAIPYYDYDAALAHVLRNHTNVLTARYGIDKARYLLKLAQVTPLSDVEFNAGLFHDFAVPPFGTTPTVSMSIPLPVWDKNKGNIIVAEAGLVRAGEEPHRVEVTLTNNLATAYLGYKTNLAALEYYRKYILPDQVRTYRGTYLREGIDTGAVFGDVVAAQQTLLSNVSSYLSLLGSLWMSVVSVADFLQTDDLFQIGQPLELPELPDLEHLPAWACPHPHSPISGAPACTGRLCPPATGRGPARLMPPADDETAPAPKPLDRLEPSPKLSQPAKPRPVQLPDDLSEMLLLPPPAVGKPPEGGMSNDQ
jgi:cobalt-zinc-cadmium efflux system outer membrane protein